MNARCCRRRPGVLNPVLDSTEAAPRDHRFADLADEARQHFRDLQSQLEGTENRINVARQRFNDAVRSYNRHIRGFLQQRVLAQYGDEFPRAESFKAETTAKTAPKVKF